MPTSSISSLNASNLLARDDTATRLEQVFRHIAATRMAGVPILNAALHVEAVGFREYDSRWLGVLITPWFMNLVAFPGPDDEWTTASGTPRTLELPAGPVPFLHAQEATLGLYLSHSLFSPMQDFPDQEYARAVAAEVLHRLFDLPAEQPPEPEVRSNAEFAAQPLSRRAFLSALVRSGTNL